MDFRVKLTRAPFSARKGRLVADLIRGKNVNTALEILQFIHKRPAHFLTKLLKSCIANVEYYNSQDANRSLENVDSDELVIIEARVDEGPLVGYRRRWRPRSRGMATPINKRTCHLKLILAQMPETQEDAKASEPGEEEIVEKPAVGTEAPEAQAPEAQAEEKNLDTAKPDEDGNSEDENARNDEE